MPGGNPPTLMTGMFVRVRIKAQVPQSLIRVPPQAIQPGDVIWSVADGKLRKYQAAIAHSSRDHVLVYEESGGLAAGMEVVTSPLATPINGLEVQTVTEAARRNETGGPGGPPGGGGRGPR